MLPAQRAGRLSADAQLPRPERAVWLACPRGEFGLNVAADPLSSPAGPPCHRHPPERAVPRPEPPRLRALLTAATSRYAITIQAECQPGRNPETQFVRSGFCQRFGRYFSPHRSPSPSPDFPPRVFNQRDMSRAKTSRRGVQS